MKNKGYTLAEVLITIGIIGILAAVLLPLINKYRPDTNMVLFIKTYDTIVTATNEIVSNEQLYPTKNAGDNIDYRLIPLANTSSITIYGNTVSGNSKYCNLLALSIHTVGSVACSDEYSTNPASFTPSFKMANGVEVEVLTSALVESYQSDIYIDVNGSDKGKNCFYSDSCTYPDRFKLIVSANGNIQVNDAKGKAYLARRADWKLRKDNIIVADEEQQPATPCQWNSSISADDAACKACEYDSSLWAGSSACQKPCQWNSSISADDAACKACEYDSSLWAGSSACQKPVTPCQWNSSISADDAACKKPTTTTSSSTGTTSTDSSSNNYKGDNNNKYLSLDFNSMGYNWHPEYDMLQKTYIPGIYKNTQNNEYYVYQIDSNGKGYWGVMTAASSKILSQKWSDAAMIEELNAAISRRNSSSGYYYYVYDGAGASDIQDMDTSVTFSAYGTTYTAKDYYWGPEEKVKAFLGETYGIYD